jgi:nicotinamide mononucleotide adenylyltransferase
VELKFDKDGALLSLKSTQSHPVEFPDRRGISKAYIIAEEKAKANIARFKKQMTSSTRLVDEGDASESNSNRSKSNTGETWSKENTRKVNESLREITEGSASMLLEGVRVIGQSYDEKKEEVTVVVGINRQSAQAAKQIGSTFGQPAVISNVPSNNGPFPSAGSEKRQAKDAADF